MAERKFQRKPEGHHDNPHHHGFHANQLRLQASELELREWRHIIRSGVVYDSTSPIVLVTEPKEAKNH
jgi:hypothetical protein